MHGLVQKAAALLAGSLLHASAIASDLDVTADTHLGCRPLTPANVHQYLGRQLSKDAFIYFPHDPQFANLTDRWSDFTEGNIAVAIEPAVTQDVAVAVKFANKCGLPFLPVNRGHGTSSALNTIEHGVSINLYKLNHIQISQDGRSASMGGGVNTHEVVNFLAASGKVTSTTNGGCTGLVGPGLGGGFGRYMGYFGLILDNIIDMTVVLANGNIIHVSSTSHPDLYWGMRGAGQNFGIVTQALFKIYDIPAPLWFYAERLDFANATSHLEPLFNQINYLRSNGSQPKELGSMYTYATINPKYSKIDPILTLQFAYSGTPVEAQRYFQPFINLRPDAMRKNESVSLMEIQPAASQDIDSDICLKTYNITANRQTYDLFKTFVNNHPEFAGSILQFEDYALEGMKAVDPASTAYPHRDDNILVSFAPVYARSTASDALALDFANQARRIWHAGDTPGRNVTAYLNYANGDESVEALYGYESWRLDRLRGLKKIYDPYNKFRFFNPIH
ncbi:MAG: hypothetical protein Q9201_003610 [Fulgogasparrea decipioides]